MLRAAQVLTLLVTGLLLPAWASKGISGPQIKAHIDETNRVILYGSTPPGAREEFDRGRVPDSTVLPGLQLALRRPARQERLLEALIRDQLDRNSIKYHRWVTAEEYGRKFGVAVSDIEKIAAWLRSHGFEVEDVARSRMRIDFSGTAGDVRDAFHTEIHRVRVHGEDHITNMSDPQIPAALAPAISGIAWLDDFRAKPQFTGATTCQPFRYINGTWQQKSTCYVVVPADLWKIYNFPAQLNGARQTIVVMENGNPCCSPPYYDQDWCSFRQNFLEASCSTGLFTVVNPNGRGEQPCTPPSGNNSGTVEAEIDPQWASASAPGAYVAVATCADSGGKAGYLIALQNYIDNFTAQIISISYGTCETILGTGGNSVLYSTYQQAASEGFSVFVAAGDGGAAGCDYADGLGYATRGITVSGYASTPYTVAVGGTTFADQLGDPANYWYSQNGQYYESAKSYIPEVPWNSSCGNELLANLYGFQQTYGPGGFCNSQFADNPGDFLQVLAGSGGPSSCAVAIPGGGCAAYSKPTWQSGIFGNRADQVRDVPDVSIIAGGGEWGHGFAYCNSIESQAGCTQAPLGPGGGGTSFSAPIFAGIQALIDEHLGEQVGNPNPTYYALAEEEYGQNGNVNCLSANASGSNNCIFYDVSYLNSPDDSTNVVPCEKKNGQVNDCYLDSQTIGVLSVQNSQYNPAYTAQPGWDFTSGIGTPNVTNLITAWPVP